MLLPGLHSAVTAVESSPDLPEADLPDALIELRGLIDRLELHFSRLAARFAATDLCEKEGAAHAGEWLRHHCNLRTNRAYERISVGENLNLVPDSVDAMLSGQIGFDHLAVIARTAEKVGPERFIEAQLLEPAREVSPSRLHYLGLHVRHAADHEAAAEEERNAIFQRRLTLVSSEEGLYFLHGVFDSQGGAALKAALDPLARPSGEGDDRPGEQRYADALVELAAHALDSGRLPRRGGVRPHVNVTTSLDTLLALKGAPGAEVEGALVPASAVAVQRLTCDATIRRVVLDSRGQVLDVGRATRVISPAQRVALNTRDRGCRWPGCERPATWTEGHHLRHWTNDGPTDMANLALLCYRHHQMVHEGGWRLEGSPEGQMVTVRPAPDFNLWAYFRSRSAFAAPAPEPTVTTAPAQAPTPAAPGPAPP